MQALPNEKQADPRTDGNDRTTASFRTAVAKLSDPAVKLHFLRSVPLFGYLSEEDLRKSCRLLQAVTLGDANTPIVRQGDRCGSSDDVFFILAAGEAGVYIRGKFQRISGPGKRVATLSSGDVFGHVALLESSQSRVRGATIYPRPHCMCFMGDQSLLVSIVESLPEVSKPKLLKHFGDLRCRDHASLFSYVQAVKRAVEFLGDAEEKNEKSREHALEISHTRSGEPEKMLNESLHLLGNDTNQNEPAGAIAFLNNKMSGDQDSPCAVFTSGHGNLLEQALRKIDTRNSSANKRWQRLIDVNARLMAETLRHQEVMKSLQHQQKKYLVDAAARKSLEVSGRHKVTMLSSFVAELSAHESLESLLRIIGGLCDADIAEVYMTQSNGETSNQIFATRKGWVRYTALESRAAASSTRDGIRHFVPLGAVESAPNLDLETSLRAFDERIVATSKESLGDKTRMCVAFAADKMFKRGEDAISVERRRGSMNRHASSAALDAISTIPRRKRSDGAATSSGSPPLIHRTLEEKCDTVVVQVEKFTGQFSQNSIVALGCALPFLSDFTTQAMLERIEEKLSSRAPGSTSDKSDAFYRSAFSISHAVRLRVCRVDNMPVKLISKGKKDQMKFKKATSAKLMKTLRIRARVVHGSTYLSDISETKAQLPSLRGDLNLHMAQSEGLHARTTTSSQSTGLRKIQSMRFAKHKRVASHTPLSKSLLENLGRADSVPSLLATTADETTASKVVRAGALQEVNIGNGAVDRKWLILEYDGVLSVYKYKGGPRVLTRNLRQGIVVVASGSRNFRLEHREESKDIDFATLEFLAPTENMRNAWVDACQRYGKAAERHSTTLPHSEESKSPENESSQARKYHKKLLKARLKTAKTAARLSLLTSTVNAVFYEWLEFPDMLIRDLPRAAQIVFEAVTSDKTVIAWCALPLYEIDAGLVTGSISLQMYPASTFDLNLLPLFNGRSEDKNRERSVIYDCYHRKGIEVSAKGATTLEIEIVGQEFGRKIVYRDQRRAYPANMVAHSPQELPADVQNICCRNALHEMTAADKDTVWAHRQSLWHFPSALLPLMRSTNFGSYDQTQEFYTLLWRWVPIDASLALSLLGPESTDPNVRAFATRQLEQLDDEQISMFMLHLVQALKYEIFVDSALARFLLRRALQRPNTVGHSLFWCLRSEMHVQSVHFRFGLLTLQFLRCCQDNWRRKFGWEMWFLSKLEKISIAVKKTHGKKERSSCARRELADLCRTFPPGMRLPLPAATFSIKDLIVEKCRVMSSKKAPVWLTFLVDKGAEPAVVGISDDDRGFRRDGTTIMKKKANNTFNVLFKNGDDLRQDQLTLAVMRVMEHCWGQSGLDMDMIPYECLSTGDMVGMIEAVPDSITLAQMVADASKGSKLRAARTVFHDKQVILRWLANAHSHDIQSKTPMPSSLVNAIRKFRSSCAGSVVFTYVLGIGDRHNDNLMMQRSGRLFHIDFGHFLGNFKSKFGIKRERAPFVFTPAMAEVLHAIPGGFDSFVKLACDAFNVLRSHGNLLISLFTLMLSCGIPELNEPKDVKWLEDKLMLGNSDAEATEHLKSQIKLAMKTRATQLNDAIHVMKHF